MGRGKVLFGKMQTPEKQPLILTLRLDTDSQAYFDAQRKLHFPPERNWLNAHLTLFHQLADQPFTLHSLAGLQQTVFDMKVTGLMSLGAGVAYKLESSVLATLHQHLSKIFAETLIMQDRQPYRPHITIQNKVYPEQARLLLAQQTALFKPFTVTALGLDLWTYLGGPWQARAFYAFSSR